MEYYFTQAGWLNLTKYKIESVGKDMKRLEVSYNMCGNKKLCRPCGVWWFLIKLNIELSHDPAITFNGNETI